jgi:hypothetical protein
MRLAIVGALILLLLLFSAFNPLIALAGAAGLSLGLGLRRLWLYRHVLARRWPLWVGLALLSAIIILALIPVNQQMSPPLGVPPVTMTPRYDGSAEYAGSAWKITDRVIFSSNSILELSRLSAPFIPHKLVNELARILPKTYMVTWSPDSVTIDSAEGTSPRRFKEVAYYLKRHSSVGKWSVSVNESYGEIVLTPSLRGTPDQGRSRASQVLTAQLESQGWRERQVNDALVFSHDRREEVRVRWFPATTTNELQIILPHSIILPNKREVLFAPDEGSRLTLSTRSHLVASSLPTAQREEGPGMERLRVSLDTVVGEQSKIDLELLSPIFRSQLGMAIRNLSFSGMVKWVVLAAVAVGADEIKRLLLLLLRSLQRRLHIPTPRGDPSS